MSVHVASRPGDTAADPREIATLQLALLAVDGDDDLAGRGILDGTDVVLALVRQLRAGSVPVICYGDGAEGWPLQLRCRMMLAGASTVLDSSSRTFEEQIGAALRKLVDACVVEQLSRRRMSAAAGALGIVGQSPAILEALRAVERSAKLSDMPVLLVGESGTGKELLARAVHLLDARRQANPFVAINCAALTKTLAEAELFGHRKGIFSGADRDRPGFVRAAHGGVLFLDEVGELDLDIQAKLLRVIQERSVLTLGDASETRVDVRIVAATHRDLKAMVTEGRFRADLLNRLWVYPIEVPPLRQRREDIPELVAFFLAKHRDADHRQPPRAGRDFLAALRLAELEGNVRELENIVQRAVALAEPEQVLGLAELPSRLWADLARLDRLSEEASTSESPDPVHGSDLNLARAIDRHERLVVEAALRASEGNQSRAAKLLGITPRSVYNKLRKHRLLGALQR